jgi:hypothetical protein
VPSKLEIGGYIKTSNGVELQYKWVELERCDCESETDPIGEENDNNFDNKLEVETPKPEVIIIEKEKEKDNKIKKSDKEGKVEKKGLESITEEIKEIIMKMKMANYTPKKIQFDLKRNHNIELTQQQVRNFE